MSREFIEPEVRVMRERAQALEPPPSESEVDDEGVAITARLKRAWKDRDICRNRLVAAEEALVIERALVVLQRDAIDARAQVEAQHAAEIADCERQMDCMVVEMQGAEIEWQEERDVMTSRIDAQAEELARMTTSYNARLWYIQQLETERAGRDMQRYVVTCGAAGGEVRQIPRDEVS